MRRAEGCAAIFLRYFGGMQWEVWQLWIAAAIGLVILEVFVPGFVLACLGVAASAAYRLARFNVAAEKGTGGPFFEGLPAPAAGVFWLGMMLTWGELQGGANESMSTSLAWIGLVVVPLAMASRRKMWGLKGWGLNPRVDQIRSVMVPIVVGVGVGTWFGCESVFLAVPLCLLLYLGLAMATTPQSQSH